jgi:hypothetical protein
MIQKFPCKQAECDKFVIYERRTIPAIKAQVVIDELQEKTVYLTCEDGHCHAYVVKGDGGE